MMSEELYLYFNILNGARGLTVECAIRSFILANLLF